MDPEQEFLRDCLARWVIDTYTTLAERRSFLNRWQKKHGANLTEDLKTRIAREWRAKAQEENAA